MTNPWKSSTLEEGSGALKTVLLVALGVVIGVIAVKLFFTVVVIAIKVALAALTLGAVALVVFALVSTLKRRKS